MTKGVLSSCMVTCCISRTHRVDYTPAKQGCEIILYNLPFGQKMNIILQNVDEVNYLYKVEMIVKC